MVSSKTDEDDRWDLYLQFAFGMGFLLHEGGGDWFFLVEE